MVILEGKSLKLGVISLRCKVRSRFLIFVEEDNQGCLRPLIYAQIALV
jgi:hypothetical protein